MQGVDYGNPGITTGTFLGVSAINWVVLLILAVLVVGFIWYYNRNRTYTGTKGGEREEEEDIYYDDVEQY